MTGACLVGGSGDKVEEKKTEAPEVHLDEDLGENEGIYLPKKTSN